MHDEPSTLNKDLFYSSLIETYVSKTQNPRFIERHWLKKQVEEKLADPGCRFLLLAGEPGAGKSAFMAWLAHLNPNWGRYFIRRDQRTPLGDVGAHSFLSQIGFQLAAIYQDFRLFDQEQIEITVRQRIGQVSDGEIVGVEIQRMVASPFRRMRMTADIQQDIRDSRKTKITGIQIEEIYSDVRLVPIHDLQYMALLDPAMALARTNPDQRIVVLIDALDELSYRDSSETLIQWLTKCPELPPNIRFVLTARPNTPELELFLETKRNQIQSLSIQENDPRVRSDVLNYIEQWVKNTPEVQTALQTTDSAIELFTERVAEKANGNLGYLEAIARAVDQASGEQIDQFLDLSSLPQELEDLYGFFLRRLRSVVSQSTIRIQDSQYEAWSEVYLPVLGVLAVAREPLTQQQIQQFGHIRCDWAYLSQTIEKLSQFLEQVDNNRYRLYHSTLSEFLTSEKAKMAYGYCYTDPVEHNRRIADYYWSGNELLHKNASDEYPWAHLPHHLSHADRREELYKLLLNYEWLQSKLNATDVDRLIADYELLPKDKDVVLVQQALRLSRGVLEQDKLQLTSQLLGRLSNCDEKGVQSLLNQINQQTAFTWLRCLTASLTPPGGSLIHVLDGHIKDVSAIASVPNKQQIVSASRDWTLRVWDTSSGRCLQVLEGHKDCVVGVVVTSSGRYAISVSDDRTVKQWHLNTDKSHNILEDCGGYITAMAALSDRDRVIIASSDHQVGIWEPERQQYRSLPLRTDGIMTAMTVMPDSDYIIFVLDNCTFQLWNLSTQECQRTFCGHDGSITTVAITPDGTQAVSASYDLTLKVWNLSSGTLERTLNGHSGSISSVVVTPDGQRAVSGSFDHTLRVWNLNTGECISKILMNRWVNCIAPIPDSQRIVSASDDGTLKTWDLEVRQKLVPNHHDNQVNDLALTVDCKQLISASRDCTLKIWDIETERRRHTLQGHTAQVSAVAVTPDHRVVSASADKTLKVWNLDTGDCLLTLNGHTASVTSVAVPHDGKAVISASADKTLRLWDILIGECLRIFEGHEGVIMAVAALPDNRRIISASVDKTLKVWDLHTGECQLQLQGHTSSVTSVAVTPDGMWAVSASIDESLKLWDLNTGRCELTLGNHQASIHAVAVTSDGRWAVSASEDKTLKLWDLDQKRCAAIFTGERKFRSCTIGLNSLIVFAGDQIGQVHSFQIQASI